MLQICIFNSENCSFARFARAFFIFVHFGAVLVLSTTWNDLFCSYVDDEGTWWHIFKFFLLSPNRWYQLNSGINIIHFAGITTWNYWETIVVTPSYIFRWRSPCRNVYPWVTEELFITRARNPIKPLGSMIFVLPHRFTRKLFVLISNSNWTEWSTIQAVIGRVISKSAEREAQGRFEITSTITPWIVRHEVQLLINHNYNKIREEYDSGLNYLTGLYIQLLSYVPKKKPFKCN